MGFNKIKLLLGGVIAAILMGLLFLPVSADELSDTLKDLEKINDKMEQTQDRLQQKEQEEKTVFGQLQKINNDITATERDLQDLKRQLSLAEANVSAAEKDLQANQKRLQSRLEALDGRLREIYIYGDVNFLEVLLNATDISDFLTRFTLMQKLVEEDSRLIAEIEAEQKAIQTKKAELEIKRDEILSLKADQERKKNTLTAQSQEKNRLMAQIQNEQAMLEKMLDDLEATSRRLEGVIQQLQKANGQEPYIPGPMTHPAPGYTRVTSPYGMRYHPVLKVNKMHTGVDFGAPMGAKVVAAKSGKVLLASAQGGYGNTIVIDHGGGITTLYAHLSAYSVQVGDTVTKGQQIGSVGSTGWSTGPHLHFEVRKNGSHVDPMPYLGR